MRRFTRRPPPHDAHDDIVVLDGFAWADYERLLKIRGEHSAPRITYLEGTVEIMSPSRWHERLARLIGRLADIFCFEHGIEFEVYGSWTVRRRRKQRGAEADECFIFGTPPEEPKRPDLAIEVIWTPGGLDKLEVWRKLAVPEVWIWEKGRIAVHVLRGDRYEVAARSTLLPDLDLERLASFLDISPASRAIREYRAALEAKGRRRKRRPRS